ncbi:hypothetical protein CHUAL_006261 [Chamberlinius hualienensis]
MRDVRRRLLSVKVKSKKNRVCQPKISKLLKIKMSDIKRLVYSFIQFLGQQLNDSSLSADAIESLEVAIQCLETAYGIQHTDPDTVASLQVSQPLLNIFTNATKNEKTQTYAGEDGQSGHSHSRQSFSSVKSAQSVAKHKSSSQSGETEKNVNRSWPIMEFDRDREILGGRVMVGIEASSSESDDDDDDDEEEDDDDDEDDFLLDEDRNLFNNNNNVSDRNGNKKIAEWPCEVEIEDDSTPLDLSMVGKSMVSENDVEVKQLGATGGSAGRGTSTVGQVQGQAGHQQQLSPHFRSEHNLVRMPPKGGCVQCGKEGRVTKRGRPHESYFGCRKCQVHLCRKRTCFQPKVTPSTVPVNEELKREAERLKSEGNNLMKTEKYAEALHLYTRAIEIDPKNAIYYCNRAAAHSKMQNHKQAIDDCRIAIYLDPNYSKAYGRMGLAFDSLNQPREAKECYEKAVRLEPQNDGYAQNLRVAEEKLRETNIGTGGGTGGGPFDLGALLNNPTLMNMATQMMSDPNIQQVMGNLLTGSAAPPAGSGTPGFEALLQAGQQLAAQMQATNPNLVELLRQQMQGGGAGGPNRSSNPNSGDSQQNN